jgi:RecA-family ATPase
MITAQRIAAAMGGEARGNQVHFPTTGHSAKDRGTSVTVDPAAPDGFLVHVHNGGDPIAVKRAILDRLGERPVGARWHCTGAYEFRDETGELLYRTKRMERPGEPKRFEAELPDGTRKIGNVRRVLYRLPELLAADPAEPVLLAEGEAKADKLAAMGFVATAIAFGAKGWRQHYAEPLAGRTVAILPDNDDPGRAFAETVRGAIEAAGGRARVVELPGLPPKGDIMDWTGTADDLRGLIEANLSEAREPDLLPLADLAAWATSNPRPKEFIWKGLIPKNELTKWDGKGGTSKSTAVQQLVTCRAAGLPFLGVDLKPGASLYVTAEEDFDRAEWNHVHMCRALGVDRKTLVGKLHISSVRGILNNELATFDAEGRIKPTSSFRRLQATLAATGADFLALDNVAHLFAGNENDRGQVTSFINLLYSLGVTVLLIGHPNKGGDSYSGSTAWLNAIRSQLVSERPDELDPDLLKLTVGKANYARPGEEIRYRWHDFALWLEDDLPRDTRIELEQTIRANADNELFLRCLRVRNEQQRPVSESTASRTYAPRVFAEMAESKKIGAARLEAAMERLFRIDHIERGFVGRIDRKDKEGLREKCAEVRAELAPTPCADVRRQGAPTALSHTLGTTYQPGAAHEAAPPAQDCPF